jgi:hypothetical protein
MRKLIGGVAMHPTEAAEWYFISIKNENDTYENLFYDRFNRKKSYGVDFVIETAAIKLAEQSAAALTEQEIEWLRTVDAVDLQTEILAAAPTGEE